MILAFPQKSQTMAFTGRTKWVNIVRKLHPMKRWHFTFIGEKALKKTRILGARVVSK